MIKKLFFPFALMLAGTQLGHAAGGTTNASPIVQFHYFKGHIGLLVKQATMINPDACERNDWYILPKEHPYYKEMLALIMSSHLADHSLAFGVEGCAQGIPTIQHILSTK
jgi:hypothetical protein